ncbi:MAG TPA: HlyD family secretion protein [Devosiaceae bacterium]|nr:HlyD family secretion protein [Devosiaceae bacterium]
MNARVTPPGKGEAEVVRMPATAEAPKPAQPSPAPAPVAAAPEPEPKKKGSRRLVLMIVVPLVLVVAGGYFYLNGGRYQDTDNAYVTQPIVSISPEVAGRVIEIPVKENQYVKAGQELFKLDPQPFQIALEQANAQLASARLNVEQLRVNYQTAVAKLDTDQQTLVIQQRTQQRNLDLLSKGVASQTTVDQGALAVQTAQQNVDLDKQAVQGALAALDGNLNIKTDDHPTVKAALAAVDSAKLNLQNATVVAPAAGVISQIPIFNVGQYVGPGTTIVSLVETDDSWIEANFKETQLGSIKVGQPAEVVIDSYPGTKLHGTVESLGAATGAEFSLIPPQNATGNWVKVVQRVPVRIQVTPNPEQPLRSGMSAEATVDTGKTVLDQMLNR